MKDEYWTIRISFIVKPAYQNYFQRNIKEDYSQRWKINLIDSRNNKNCIKNTLRNKSNCLKTILLIF